jgi:hypothetical protein
MPLRNYISCRKNNHQILQFCPLDIVLFFLLCSYSRNTTPIFLKEIRSPKTGARITFSEYMESLYEQMESEIKEKTTRKKRKI